MFKFFDHNREFFHNLSLLLLRVTFGGLMLLNHGWGKLTNYANASEFPDPLGISASLSWGLTSFAEAICSFLIILGLATRWASIPLVIAMGVAVFIVHGGDPINKKELGLVYLVVFLILLFRGGGAYALDKLIKR